MSKQKSEDIRQAISLLRSLGYAIVPPTEEHENALVESFNKFWEAYGKKVDRKRTLSKWKHMTKSQRQAAIDYIPTYRSKIRNIDYQKYPLTYLNSEIWNEGANLFSQQLPPSSQQLSISVTLDPQQLKPVDIDLRMEMEKQRFLDMIDICKGNPHSACAKPVMEAYRNGTLKKLGIAWHPHP